MLATTSPHAIPLLARTSSLPAGPGNDDGELTSLSWLHKPGVLNSMCNALTGSPHRISTLGTRSLRKPRDQRGGDRAANGEQGDELRPRRGSCNTTEKMLNVVLSVRNRRYNGEDAHKPPLSFACMIFMALESSPTKTLPVKQIYEWIQWKFPHYRTALPGWKNSVRHSLSLNKCFKKLEKLSRKTRSVVTKGGLWTVDPAYRESLLAALKLNPYHPYHKYFTAPYFPRSMIAALRAELELAVTDKDLDPAERDAALSMCLISGGGDSENSPLLALRAIYHDHNYTELPSPPPCPGPFSHGLSLAEVAAAAELILGQADEEEEEEGTRYKKRQRRKRKKGSVDEDEAYESEAESVASDDVSDDVEYSLADSGYGGNNSPSLSHESRTSSLDDLCGANALLCLANNGSSSEGASRQQR